MLGWLKKNPFNAKPPESAISSDHQRAPAPISSPELLVAPPPWGPGPEPTERQILRQTALAMLAPDDTLDTRRSYAEWLQTNGWGEDAERLLVEIEREELSVKEQKVSARCLALISKPWTVHVGGERVDVEVYQWNKGLPCYVALTWEQLDRFGVEILRTAPIQQVHLTDKPEVVSEDIPGGERRVKVTLMTCRGVILTGESHSTEGALLKVLSQHYGIPVALYWMGGFASGVVVSGMIATNALTSSRNGIMMTGS